MMTTVEYLLSPARGQVMIAAHRGSFGMDVLENTVTAFQIAAGRGAALLELDLAKTSDGVLVGHHDETLERLFGRPGHLNEVPWQALQAMPPRNYYGHPTKARLNRFEEILDAVGKEATLVLDRSWSYFDDVLKILRQRGIERDVLLKYNIADTAAHTWAMGHPGCLFIPMAKPCHLHPAAYTDLARMRQNGGLAAVEIEPRLPADFASVERLHSMDIKVWCNSLSITPDTIYGAGYDDTLSFTQGGDAGWGRQVDLGVDILQTDWPAELYRYLQNRGLCFQGAQNG